MEYLLLFISWIAFYALHSLMASSKLKRILADKMGSAFKWYRLFYSILFSLLLIGIMLQSALIQKTLLISTNSISTYLGYVFATFGTILLVKSAKKVSFGHFIGWKPSKNTESELVTTGIYSKIRHPLYAGLILIFLGYFFFSGSLTSVIHLGCLILYLPIGIYYEEKNLTEIYGKQYLEYKQKVPAILPWI